MNDISYEILDQLKAYGADRQALVKILSENSRPEFLYALSDMRENLLEWMEFAGTEKVLQVGSDYGALTGLLARRCAQVTVADSRDENLAVNRKRNGDRTNITYVSTAQDGIEEQKKQEAREALTDRKIAIEESGSMAEAALRLNGVFEAADQAVRQYLENMERVMRERRGES